MITRLFAKAGQQGMTRFPVFGIKVQLKGCKEMLDFGISRQTS